MEFINDNLTLIIVISVIIVMTLIGYIADKSNFVEKRKEKEKNKKEQVANEKKNRKTKEQQQFDAEIGDGKDLVMDEGNIDFPVELDKDPWEINIPESNNNDGNSKESAEESSSEDNLNFDAPVEFSVNNENDLEGVNDDKTIPEPLNDDALNLEQYDNNLSEEGTNLEEQIDDNLEDKEIVNDINEIDENQENKETKKDKKEKKDSDSNEKIKEEENLPLPEIDSLKEVDDDDIWSF